MLDKSYVRALRTGDKIEIRTRHKADSTMFPVEISVAKTGTDEYRILILKESCETRGVDTYAAFEELQAQLLFRNLIFCCCGNCWFLQFTGLSREMSAGENGYCLLYAKKYGRSLSDVVAIFDYCNHFKYKPQGMVMEMEEKFKER
jgi:hypothetical protein